MTTPSRLRLLRLVAPTLAAATFAVTAAAPGRTAHADPAGTEAAAAPAQAQKEPAVKVTAISMPNRDVPEDTMDAAMHALDVALKQNARLETKDLEARLGEFEQDLPTADIEAARAALKEGQEALAAQKYPLAVERLDLAASSLAKVLPYIKKQELADAMAGLAVAKLARGDKKGGHAEFVRLLTWRSDYAYDTARLPAKFQESFEAAQRDTQRLQPGSLRLTSDPPGAIAYIDGTKVGPTPCDAKALLSGEHFLTMRKRGYKKSVQAVQVVGDRTEDVTMKLIAMGKYLLVEQAVAAIDPTLGGERATDDMDTFRQVLFLDQAVFVKAKPVAGAPEATLAVDAYLYDLRTRLRLTHVTRAVKKREMDAQMAMLAKELYVNVNYSGELAAPKEKDLPTQEKRAPVYKTWWFWTATAAVVVGAVGAGTAIYLSRPNVCKEGDFCPVVRY